MTTESVSVLLEQAKILINLDLVKYDATEIQHLAYMWADTPVKVYLGAPIYATDEYRLPGAPWVFSLT